MDDDVTIIQSLPISRIGVHDSMGYHFTKLGKYKVNVSSRILSLMKQEDCDREMMMWLRRIWKGDIRDL